MNYAVVENGVVTNVIWLYPGNAREFPHAVPMGNVPAGIGDTYENGVFVRNGERLLSPEEESRLLMSSLLGGVNDVHCE